MLHSGGWKPNGWLLALGSLLSMTQTACCAMLCYAMLSMTQTGCWETQPGNEAFGKVVGGTKAFHGFNKRFAGTSQTPF